MRIPVGDLLTLLEGGAVIASKADDPEKFKAVSRWMAMVLQKAGFPRIKGRKRVYRIPARPFFTRVANRFIRDHKDPARVFRVDRWKLYIYVNREDNSDAPIKVAKPGAQG